MEAFLQYHMLEPDFALRLWFSEESKALSCNWLLNSSSEFNVYDVNLLIKKCLSSLLSLHTCHFSHPTAFLPPSDYFPDDSPAITRIEANYEHSNRARGEIAATAMSPFAQAVQDWTYHLEGKKLGFAVFTLNF